MFWANIGAFDDSGHRRIILIAESAIGPSSVKRHILFRGQTVNHLDSAVASSSLRSRNESPSLCQSVCNPQHPISGQDCCFPPQFFCRNTHKLQVTTKSTCLSHVSECSKAARLHIPPSTMRHCPVIIFDCGPAKKLTTPAISSGACYMIRSVGPSS